jgi:hypothetical protein
MLANVLEVRDNEPATGGSMSKKLSMCVGAAAMFASVLVGRPAHATDDVDEPAATGKGITGGVLLGAEVVMLTEAAFKVKPTWAYLVGGLAGGVAGGIGGYFVERDDANKTSMYLLAGGMALIIPTTVAVLSAKAYEPPADYTEDRGITDPDQPVAEPPQPTGEPAVPEPPATNPTDTPPATTPAPAPEGARSKKSHKRVARHKRVEPTTPLLPPALVGVGSLGPGSLTMGLPAVAIRQVYSRVEIAQYGVKQATEVRVPVFNVLF